jgi:hypothetical protein
MGETMDDIERLRRYGKQSAASYAKVDVTARVMQTLRTRRDEQPVLTLKPLVAVAAASWLAVLGTGLLVQDAWSTLQDPIASLVSPFVVSMQ